MVNKNWLKENKIIIIILFSVLILGAILRFYDLGKNSFVADEFLDINASYGYHKTGKWHAWDFNWDRPAERINDASDKRAWIYRWQVAQLFRFLPSNEAVARSISAVWGVLSIILIYFVAKYFSNKKEIGLIAAFLFAISISGIIFDRKLRMYAMFFPVFLAFSWMFFCFFEEKYKGKKKIFEKIYNLWGLNIIYLIPAILLGLLSYHLHKLTVNILIIFTGYAIIQWGLSFKKNKTVNINKYSVSLIPILIGGVISKIFFASKFSSLMGGITLFENNFKYFSKIFIDYSLPLVAAIFFFFGFYFIFKKQKLRKKAVWLASSFLIILFAATFLWKRSVGSQYIFFAQSFEIILIASGIYYISDFLKRNLKKHNKKIFFISLALSLIILPNYAYFFEKNNTYRQRSSSSHEDYREAYDYFLKHKKEGEVLIAREFRNYYFSGAKVDVVNFGGESSPKQIKKLSKDRLQKIVLENKCGWIIWSDNDGRFISKEAKEYIEDELDTIESKKIKGSLKINYWCNKDVEDKLRFGFITDAHSYSKPVKNKEKEIIGYEVNWRAQKPMKAFTKRMNEEFHPDFVIENGDLIESGDRAIQEFKEINHFYEKVDAPKYHVLGNHELRDMVKETWLGLVGYEKPYYYFDVRNYRMIVLDGNYLSPINGERDVTPENGYYPGYVSKNQIRWLQELLEDSADKKIIFFVHQPPVIHSKVKNSNDLLVNGDNLRSIFKKYNALAVFSGHIEELCYQKINGVKYFIFPGFHKMNSQLDKNAQYVGVFSEVSVNGSEVNIEMFYLDYKHRKSNDYKSIIINEETASCKK